MKHTPNGPSSLSKRFFCSASLSQEAGLERDRFDEDADSGTRCHQAMENLLKGISIPSTTDEEFKKVEFAVNALNHLLCGDKILYGTGRTEAGGIVHVELTMDNLPYSIPGDPECGTVDLAIIYPDHILMLDWKFGGSFVDHPRWNWQLKGLSTGIWDRWPGREIHTAIVQPRAGADHKIEPWIYRPEERDGFVSDINRILVNCHENQDHFSVGKGCQFCEAARQNTCPARRMAMGMFAGTMELDPEKMDPTTRARTLMAARAARDSAEDFIKACKAQVKATGEIPTGWRAAPTSAGNVRLDPNPSAPSWPKDSPNKPKMEFDF